MKEVITEIQRTRKEVNAEIESAQKRAILAGKILEKVIGKNCFEFLGIYLKAVADDHYYWCGHFTVDFPLELMTPSDTLGAYEFYREEAESELYKNGFDVLSPNHTGIDDFIVTLKETRLIIDHVNCP